MNSTKITILGIGNRLMMDDGVGIIIVEKLMKENTFNQYDHVQYVVGESDIEFCLDIIDQSDFTIIIDAMNTGDTLGKVSSIPFEDIAIHKLGISPHDQHLFFSISQASHLKGVVIGIEIVEIEFHYGLSPQLQSKLTCIKNEVVEAIEVILLNY